MQVFASDRKEEEEEIKVFAGHRERGRVTGTGQEEMEFEFGFFGPPQRVTSKRVQGILKRSERVRVQGIFKEKVQKIKDARDYSFLFSDDVELPSVPTANPATETHSKFGSYRIRACHGVQRIGPAAKIKMKRLQELSTDFPKAKLLTPKQPSSKDLIVINKPLKIVSSHTSMQDNRLKTKPARVFPDDRQLSEEKEEGAFSMLRNIIGTKGYVHCDDDDDSDMEASFDEIMKEERRSAVIARKEDKQELRLIEEEGQRDRMRKLAKKPKLNHK